MATVSAGDADFMLLKKRRGAVPLRLTFTGITPVGRGFLAKVASVALSAVFFELNSYNSS